MWWPRSAGGLAAVPRPIRKQLHDAYRESGVEIRGLVTGTKTTVHRGALTRIETRRNYQLRYAYKDPASDTVIMKDYVHVKREQLHERLFTAVMLPGRPDSGVPKFLIRDLSKGFYCNLSVASLFSLYCAYVFTLLLATLTGHCQQVQYETRVCPIGIFDMVKAVVVIGALGLALGYGFHRQQENAVPGRVYRRVSIPRHPPSSSMTTSSATRIDLNEIDDTPIPMVQAVAILDDDDEDDNTNSNIPAATATVQGEQQPQQQDGMKGFPQAKAAEFV